MTEKALRVRLVVVFIALAHLPFLIGCLFDMRFLYPMLIADCFLILYAAIFMTVAVCDDDGWKAICKLMDWKWAS